MLGASLSTWLAERQRRHPGRAQLFCHAPDTYDAAITAVNASAADIVLIDCPSRATQVTAALAADADFTIFPVVPGGKDITRTSASLKILIDAGVDPKRLAVIMTRTGSDSEARLWRQTLQAIDFGNVEDPAHTPIHLNVLAAPHPGIHVVPHGPRSAAGDHRGAPQELARCRPHRRRHAGRNVSSTSPTWPTRLTCKEPPDESSHD